MDSEKTKKIMEIALAVVILVVGGVWIWKGDFGSLKDGKVLVTPPKDLKIETYSLSGQITSIDKEMGLIVFNANIFYKIGEEIKPEQETRSATITADTKFTRMTQSAKEGIKIVDASLDDLKVGTNITVYSSKNPVTERRLNVDRVEISL